MRTAFTTSTAWAWSLLRARERTVLAVHGPLMHEVTVRANGSMSARTEVCDTADAALEAAGDLTNMLTHPAHIEPWVERSEPVELSDPYQYHADGSLDLLSVYADIYYGEPGSFGPGDLFWSLREIGSARTGGKLIAVHNSTFVLAAVRSQGKGHKAKTYALGDNRAAFEKAKETTRHLLQWGYEMFDWPTPYNPHDYQRSFGRSGLDAGKLSSFVHLNGYL